LLDEWLEKIVPWRRGLKNEPIKISNIDNTINNDFFRKNHNHLSNIFVPVEVNSRFLNDRNGLKDVYTLDPH